MLYVYDGRVLQFDFRAAELRYAHMLQDSEREQYEKALVQSAKLIAILQELVRATDEINGLKDRMIAILEEQLREARKK